MEVLGPLIFFGFIWVALTWRCFSVTSICQEVAVGKTTKDALLFQLLQGGIFLFLAFYIVRYGRSKIPNIITAISLFITGVWYFYSCVQALVELKKTRGAEGSSGSEKKKGSADEF